MNKNNIFKKLFDPVILITLILILIILLTWIPHKPYSGSEIDNNLIPENGKYGIFDTFYAIYYGLIQMFPIMLYIISIGYLFKILENTNSFNVLFKDLIKGVNENKYFFSTLIFLFGFLLSSILGFFEQFIILYPIFYIAFNSIGINKKTTTILVLISLTMGRAFTTIGPYAYIIGYENINTNDWSNVNTFILVRFLIMIIGIMLILPFIFYLIKKQDNENLEIKEFNLEIKNNRKVIYLAWSAFALMIIVLIVGTINWDQYFGEDWNNFNNWWTNNLWFISSIFSPIGKWGFAEKTIIIALFVLIISLILKNQPKSNNNSQLKNSINDLIKTYIVFSISKSIAIIITYSGIADIIVNSINISNNEYLFIFSLIPIFLLFTFIMNSQTSSFLIFTPIISSIIFNANFANPEAILFIFMFVLTFVVGFNSMITPTQSLFTISIEIGEINYKDYYKKVLPFGVYIFSITIFVILPLIILLI